jgi:hypothetical protein
MHTPYHQFPLQESLHPRKPDLWNCFDNSFKETVHQTSLISPTTEISSTSTFAAPQPPTQSGWNPDWALTNPQSSEISCVPLSLIHDPVAYAKDNSNSEAGGSMSILHHQLRLRGRAPLRLPSEEHGDRRKSQNSTPGAPNLEDTLPTPRKRTNKLHAKTSLSPAQKNISSAAPEQGARSATLRERHSERREHEMFREFS